MDIEGCLLGSPPLVGATFNVPTTSVGSRLSPLTPLAPSSLPTTCGSNFWGAHYLCWAGLLPACSPHSQLAPLTPNGQGRLGVCYTMFWIPTTSVGARVLGVRGSELGARGARGSKEQAECYTRF